MNNTASSPDKTHRQMRQLLAFSVLGFAVLLVIAWTVVETVKVNGETFRKMTQGKDLLADVLPPPAYLLELHDTAQMMLAEPQLEKIDRLIQKAKKSAADYAKRHAIWESSSLPRSILNREAEAYAQGHAFIVLHDSQFVPLIRSGDREGARRVFATGLNPAYENHRAAIDALVVEVSNYNTLIAAEARQQESNGKWMITGFGVSVILLIASWSVLLSRRMAEQRSMELRQREDEERYRFALEAASMGAWEWDIINGEVRWSGAVEPMFGLEKGAFAGTYVAYLCLLHPEDRAIVEKAIARAIGGNTDAYFVEHRVVYPDGSLHWLEGKGRVEKDASGTPIRMRGTISDITNRKRMESERDTLEERLRQSQRIESVGRLASGVAHDFNNILTSIMGYTELALLDVVQNPARQRIEGIQTAAERAGRLTKQLLAFSRKQILQPEYLNVNSVIKNLQGMLERLLGSQVHLHVSEGAKTPTIKADRGQIEQVVLNLVVNARDAMPHGGTITISLGTADPANLYVQWGSIKNASNVVVLSVSDEGTGISPEVRSQLFQPYFTTKAEGKGTGLGLSTVYGIVEQSGGGIGLESEPGKGTTFKIYLPAQDSPAVPEMSGSVNGTKAERRISDRSATVLVVEDDPAIATIVQFTLSRQGFKVLTAESGDAAMKLLTQNRESVELILTDVMLPGKSGRALAEEAVHFKPGLKVLFMSGFAADEMLNETIERLGANLLPKPFSQELLANKVSELLNFSANAY